MGQSDGSGVGGVGLAVGRRGLRNDVGGVDERQSMLLFCATGGGRAWSAPWENDDCELCEYAVGRRRADRVLEWVRWPGRPADADQEVVSDGCSLGVPTATVAWRTGQVGGQARVSPISTGGGDERRWPTLGVGTTMEAWRDRAAPGVPAAVATVCGRC
ncbi:uncharacterized protein A4U43_C07F14180 [Asparagus officinalis]|uniref:Uncharacterized protein n=1 Tax=Asparagus officinalis TaxID=4686 RepID=A0A5P1EC13_ASPOF|nr:uncharacterized protein A4U43_C07F14180 [Asparagus officinalis]